ncbi:hypothetical protein BH23ACT8_BH23ACT8_14760 [soil metagenome]|jgi:hypothetical protein
MSLRYGRLFDATVRADYERALTLAKQRFTSRAHPTTPNTTAPTSSRESRKHTSSPAAYA